MPEFPGYTGDAKPELPVIKIKAITHRRNPIPQTVIGPSEEHVNMAGLPTEASILTMVDRAMPGFVQNVFAHTAGGGKYLAVLQVKKRKPTDEGMQRQAALLAFSAFSELKTVILVDEDVDLFDTDDVLWACRLVIRAMSAPCLFQESAVTRLIRRQRQLLVIDSFPRCCLQDNLRLHRALRPEEKLRALQVQGRRCKSLHSGLCEIALSSRNQDSLKSCF